MLLRPLAILLLPLCSLAAAQDITLQGLTGGNYRFKDIGGQAFAQPYIDAYTYTSANVTFSFDVNSNDYLSGTVTATGLKPNFAYQIKLAGNPSAEATTDAEKAAADDVTNERLGRLGRWWRAAPNPANSNDADYDANKNTPGYIYEGYLIINFFVTDSAGNATLHFDGNNSFHVLWRTDQRPQAIGDGPLLPVTVPDTTGNPAYDTALAARDFSLYGEHEPSRAAPGTLAMPHAHYRCRLFLTEESFHDSGALAGSWTTAMAAPFEFDIPTAAAQPPNTPPVNSILPLEIMRLRSSLNFSRHGHDRAQINGTLNVPAGFNVADLEVQARVFNAVQNFTLNGKGRDLVSNGTFELLAPKPGSTSAFFRLRLHDLNFAITPGDLAASQLNLLTLKIGGDTYAGPITPKMRITGQKVSLTYIKK